MRIRSGGSRTGMHRTLARAGLSALAGLALLGLAAPAALPAQAGPSDSAFTRALHWRFIGPTGGRTTAITGVAGDPMVIYAGAASGGVWRTLNGGITWKPVFDREPVSSIGALAVAPSAPNEVWAGTGETWYIRGYTSMGDGVWKSTDRGDSWTHVGLEKTGRIARIVVDPNDPDVVWVCALGDAHNHQQERGVYTTADGGKTWTRSLFVNEETGCSDLAMDPADPETVFAGMWHVMITNWDLHSGGPGSGLYVTHDGGAHWSRVGGGLPTDSVGKTSVDIARSDPERVYTLMEGAGDPGLYRSDDGGATWSLVTHSHGTVQRAPYYTRFRVAPDDPDRLYFLSTNFAMSEDGGKTVQVNRPTASDDNHDMWIDPTNADRILVAYDHGVLISPDGGKSWSRPKLPLAQMYHVAVDDRRPYWVYGNRQDAPAYMGPSRTRTGEPGPNEGDWIIGPGCESGFSVPDTAEDRVWGGCYNGQLQFVDLDNRQIRQVDPWPMSAIGWEPKNVKERYYWVFPIALSPFQHGKVYVGSQRVHVTTDGGQSWKVISPDLTRDVKSHESNSTGLTTDDIMTFSGASLFALAESPVKQGVLWAGSNDGLVHVSRDGGESWTDVTGNIKGIPQWAWISNIEPSHFDAGTAYVSVDDHMQGDFAPYIYETTDYGKSWKSISGSLPHGPVGNVHMVAEDPVRKGLLFAGTENGVYFSLDDGIHWRSLQADLPHAPAYWLAIQPEFHDLVLATYGRGIWILDDISPLERMADSALASGLHLFRPRDTYRFKAVQGRLSGELQTHMHAENPKAGVPIDYWLGAAAGSPVSIEILDSSGNTVRRLEGTGTPGLNRVWWDLRYPNRKTVRLWMPPPNAPWRQVPNEGLPSQQWGGEFQRGPEVVPGTYTVRITAAGKQVTRPLTVLKDPHSRGSLADIQAQVALSRQLLAETNQVVDAVNRLEWIRRQLDDLRRSLVDEDSGGALADSVARVLAKATDVEEMFMDVHRPGGVEEFQTPMKLYGRYIHLMTELDVSSDFPPTAPDEEVHQVLKTGLSAAQDSLRSLVGTVIPALNDRLRSAGRPAVGGGAAGADGPSGAAGAGGGR